MVFLYILLGILALVYALFICFSAKALYEDYKKGKVIPLIPKGSDKIVLYLCFPVFIPFLIASRLRVQSNRLSSKKYRTLVLSEYFDNDAASLDNYEKHVASRCGTFDPGFHKVLYDIRNLKENEITSHKLYDMVNKVVQLCNITIDQKKISQAAYDILSCFFKKKYKESDTQRIIRLRKAGYNVRPMQLYKNEEKHPLKCDFEGKENCCPKDCNTCAISIKTEADMCQVDGQFQDAINKYIEALQKEPRFAEAWNNLASAYGSIGEHSLALDAYLKAIDIDAMYGKALWGAALALRKMGRNGEAMTILNELLKYCDYKEANETVNSLKKAGVKPIAINRDLDYQCYKQIMFIAKSYGLDNNGNKYNETIAKNLFEEIFSPFFDYLIDYYKDININRISKITSEFMLFAGMASSKYLRDNRKKLVTEGIVKVLSGPRGFFAMDEECCDYLGIPYKPDNGNALSPCISQLTQEANRIYSDIIAQVKEIPHIKILIHDISKQFFAFGFSYVEYKMKNSLDIYVKPNDLSPRDVLTLRLKSMANDPAIKTAERSEGAMCYSIRMPEKEAYRCSHCGAVYYDTPETGVERYFMEIRKMGYDCKLERWCKLCCKKNNIEISQYSESRFVFFIRLDASEPYRISSVYSYELEILYQFFKNENMYSGGFGKTSFVGESPEVIEKLIGIKLN